MGKGDQQERWMTYYGSLPRVWIFFLNVQISEYMPKIAKEFNLRSVLHEELDPSICCNSDRTGTPQVKGYDDATRLLSADLQYAPAAEKSRVARVLAMCSLGMRQFDRWPVLEIPCMQCQLQSSSSPESEFKPPPPPPQSPGLCPTHYLPL